MRLDLEIGATTESWSLGPDDRLHSWLRSCPWRSGEFSQARTLSISRVEDVEAIWREIRRLIYAADEGVYSPQVFAPHTIHENRLNALLSVCFFGEPRDLTGLQLKRLVTSRLQRAPLVIFLMSSTDLKEQMRSFTETLNRDGTLYPLTLLHLRVQVGPFADNGEFQLYPAQYKGHVIQAAREEPSTLWGRYLHSKASWESGGDIQLAKAFGSAWALLPMFDDEALEASCQAVALERWQQVPCRTRELFEGHKSDYYGRRGPTADYLPAFSSLVTEGVVWQPPEKSAPMPTAWAIRSSRQTGSILSAIERAALVNAPLVAELLTWSFHLESIERSSQLESIEEASSEEATSLFEAFIARKPWSAATFYPRNYPFRLSVASLESFGTLCVKSGSDHRSEVRRRLLTLRNGLCHGHYVAWKNIEVVLSINVT